MSVSNRDAGEGTVSSASLTFTATNATTAQTVTDMDDEVDDSDEPYRIGNCGPSTPDDATYDALEAGDVDDVLVVNTDDDATPEVTLPMEPASVSENVGVSRMTAAALATANTGTVMAVDNKVDALDKTGDGLGHGGKRSRQRRFHHTIIFTVATIADDDEKVFAFARAGGDPEDFEGCSK